MNDKPLYAVGIVKVPDGYVAYRLASTGAVELLSPRWIRDVIETRPVKAVPPKQKPGKLNVPPPPPLLAGWYTVPTKVGEREVIGEPLDKAKWRAERELSRLLRESVVEAKEAAKERIAREREDAA